MSANVIQNITIIQDPRIVSGLINQIAIDEGYLWRRLIGVETTEGLKWKSRARQVRALMAKLLGVAEKLPFLMKGSVDDREGGFIKLGGALPIDPKELIGFDKDGEIPAELSRIALALRTGIEGAIEWVTLRGFFGLSVTLESGADSALEAVGDTDTVTTAWSDIAATGIDDLLTLKETSKTLNQRQNPEFFIMSSQYWEYLRLQTITQKMVYSTAGAGTTVSAVQVQDLLRANDLPPVVIYDGYVEVESGTGYVETRIIDEKWIAAMPSTRKFPEGYGRMFVTKLSDQIINANKGLVDPQLDGENFIYGWVEVQSNPGRYEVNGYTGSGFDLEATSKVATLDAS